MDYKGQQLCEYIYTILVILFGAIAWFVGYSQNDFFLTCKGWAIGLGLSLVICIPDWPFFNRNKVVWSDEVGKLAPTAKESKNKATTPKSSSGKKKSTKTN